MHVAWLVASIPSHPFREVAREKPKGGLGGACCLIAFVLLCSLAFLALRSFLQFSASWNFVEKHGLKADITSLQRLDHKEWQMTARLETGVTRSGDSLDAAWELRIQLYVRGTRMRQLLPEQFHCYLPAIRYTPPPDDGTPPA